jgi:hypothetical protein
MNEDDYKRALNGWRNADRQNLAAMAQWAEQDALPWLWKELAGILGQKNARPLQPAEAIRMGLQTTPADREKMPLKPSYYHAHLSMLDSEAKKYIKAVGRFMAQPNPFAGNAAIYNLHGGLISLLNHGIILFEQAGQCLLNLPGVYGSWRRTQEHPFEIFKGAEQIIYGRFSGLTHDDRAPFTPVAVLRTAVENRLRSAFGIYGYYDPRTNGIRPIDLGQLIEAITPRLAKIEFAVDFHDVVKIYRWSNPYLHAGWRDFVWVPGYALEFLHPLFADTRPAPGGGWSIDGGVRMPRETWRDIRRSFEEAPRRNVFVELWRAIVGVFKRRRGRTILQLNGADEQSSACVFLN